MATYKKLNDVITIKYNHSAAINITLSYNGSPLYFGLEDQDGNYEGNLTQTRYDLSTDQTGCSAYTINQQGSTSGTALLIVASITKNDSENQRTITYKYNNTPLFKILQKGFLYLYFNALHIRTEFKDKSYMVKINNPNTYTINTPNFSAPHIYFNDYIMYYYYNPSYDNIPDINSTYACSFISGVDILNGTFSNKALSKYPSVIGELNDNGVVKPVQFDSIKQTIQYIGIYYLTDDRYTYQQALLIDFTKSSKYKVE